MNLEDRTYFVTGASSGIGRALVEALAARGANVVLASRSEARTTAVCHAIRSRHPAVDARVVLLDMADLTSVRRAADGYLQSGQPIDVLVNNAGVAGTRGLSPQGFLLTYATNHIGPFLLTSLLLPRVREAPQGRIVNVASAAHWQAKRIDWSVLEPQTTPKRGGYADYAATKIMNVLHAKELARRLADTRVTTYSLHPGVVASNIWRALPRPLQWIMKRFMISNEAGAETPLYCATAPELAGTTGRYYDKCREAPVSPLADDPALASELWDRTEAAVSAPTRR